MKLEVVVIPGYAMLTDAKDVYGRLGLASRPDTTTEWSSSRRTVGVPPSKLGDELSAAAPAFGKET